MLHIINVSKTCDVVISTDNLKLLSKIMQFLFILSTMFFFTILWHFLTIIYRSPLSETVNGKLYCLSVIIDYLSILKKKTPVINSTSQFIFSPEKFR